MHINTYYVSSMMRSEPTVDRRQQLRRQKQFGATLSQINLQVVEASPPLDQGSKRSLQFRPPAINPEQTAISSAEHRSRTEHGIAPLFQPRFIGSRRHEVKNHLWQSCIVPEI